MRDGVIPSIWKNANVTPVFKKGGRDLAENYRPVSLTCVCCKILEHIITSHIRQHLDHNNILSAYQHGFRKLHSCETQLLVIVQDLLFKHDKHIPVENVKKTVVYTRVNGASHIENCKNYEKVITHQHIA